MDAIAVVGIGCNFPGGEGLDNFWKVLVQGKNCAVEIPEERFDSSYWYDSDETKPGKSRTSKACLIDGLNEFDQRFFGITDAEAEQMDPQHKLLLECSFRALENAGMPMEKASGTRTGVFLGLMNRDFESSASNLHQNSIDHLTGTGAVMSIAANRISYTFNLTGPSFAIDSACSSSLVALHLACQAIRQGDCEMALCGGVSCMFHAPIFVALSKAKMISPDGTSKPFSSDADGYGRGEGCGMVLLKPLNKALEDFDNIWGIISKTAVNQDGHTITPMTKPSQIQQEELLRSVYSTESECNHVQYMEAHGTGTPVGDPIEAGSISNIIAKVRPFGSEPLCIGSVKGNIGHTESAAGVAGLIKVLLMMKHEAIVPSLFYSESNTSIDVKSLRLKIPTKVEKWPNAGGATLVAGINNFGFGGTNAHALVTQHVRTHASLPIVRKSQEYFVLSAASEKSLTMMIEDTASKLLRAESTDNLQTLAYTSTCRRSHLKHKYKRAFRTSSLTDLKHQLTSAFNKRIVPALPDPRLVLVFCGNGVTYRGMCRQLLKEEPVFREKVKEVERLFQKYTRFNMVDTLENDAEQNEDFSKPDIIQPLLFAIQVALAELLKHWGIRPDTVLGHSVGEVAAAHCSGLLTLEDAVKVIHYRSALQSRVTGGKMLVVGNIVVSEVLKLLQAYTGKVCLAAYNSPQSCTLSGDADAIQSFHQKLSSSYKGKNLFLHVLDVAAAYHSHLMDPILLEIEKNIGHLQKNSLEVDLISTVTGKIASQDDFCTGTYWSRNIREPVAFEMALKSAATQDRKNMIFVEIGPRRALQRNILETLGKDTVVLSSVQPDKDHETMLDIICRLFECGVSIDWTKLYNGCYSLPAALPIYHFDRVKKPIHPEKALKGFEGFRGFLTQMDKDGTEFTCDLSSDSLSYLHEHKNNNVALIPGAFHVELGLTSVMAHAKPKVPLSSLQLSIHFERPFILNQNTLSLKVTLDPTEPDTAFKIHSNTATFASGHVAHHKVRLIEEPSISLDLVLKRCPAVMTSDELYRNLSLGGFQYGSVFRNTGDVYYGPEYREVLSFVTVPEEILPQLHDYCIHPVLLDYVMQLVPVTGAKNFLARPGFPVSVGGLTVFDSLEEEMAIYLKSTNMGTDHIEVFGCFTNKAGRVLAEIKNVVIKYTGSLDQILEEYFYHNEFNVISESITSVAAQTALVFSDQTGVCKALQQHLNPASRYISFTHAKDLMCHGFQGLLSRLNIPDVKKHFQEILFVWGDADLTMNKVDDILDNVTRTCEMFRQIVVELKAINFPKSIRTVTYRSADDTVDHISSGFVLSGMTRACAAEISHLSFQLIDIGSVSTEDIRALANILSSYPCRKYPELVVNNGQIQSPSIVRTPVLVNSSTVRSVQTSQVENFILQTADPYKMTSLSAYCDHEKLLVPDKSVEVQLGKICVHSSDYFPVSVSDLNFGQTMYWNEHTNQNHKLVALDFSGTVTALGKDVRNLKVGDHIASCYPVAASSKVIIPAAACYKTKRLPYLRDIPCVSYYALSWTILQDSLPKVKQQQRLCILSSVPDSGLLKVLMLTANKSGWNAVTITDIRGTLQNGHKADALVLLPPFDQHAFNEACQVPGILHIVAVCERTSSFDSQLLRAGNDRVRIQTIPMSSVPEKGSLRAHKPQLYKWLKSMHLDRKAVGLPNATFQRGAGESIHLLPVGDSQSYFSSRTLHVVVLKKDDTTGAQSDIPLSSKAKSLFQKNSVYIVSGGLTGLGFETVKFIAYRGGSHIVILSRRSPSPEMQKEILTIENQSGTVVSSLQCDVSDPQQVAHVMTVVGQKFPTCSVKGVFHSAVVLHDGLVDVLDKSLYEKVLKPKVNGVLNLHHATMHCSLDYFVCYSSISAFLGNASQTNYAAANTFLDTFCHYRRNLGLPAQSINWGALNLGLLLNKEHFQKFLEARGMPVMEVYEIHRSLEECLLLNKPQQVICKFNFAQMSHNVLSQNSSLTMRLSNIIVEGLMKSKFTDQMVKPTESQLTTPPEYLRSVLSELLNIESDDLNEDTSLTSLGIDSMLAMTLQNVIFQGRGVNIPLVNLLDPNSTLSTLVAFLGKSVNDDSYSSDEMFTRF
ncbi:LOW QUALITY PROTEIN: highly reducing polyketide synthase SAT13-like [Denticeps clupeoides]|uniref:LOW QUALITY PROTEIN: highly reducing polyketide synthase SAT13-like n=1 Tax=Denticeps clupeoides TaxID=299321 RepID=UPI0010A37EF1|nr:LOW QUALITY PROTEIN: highly reducing polyketide synthase SAT13-like [Denticeps clupeoides]